MLIYLERGDECAPLPQSPWPQQEVVERDEKSKKNENFFTFIFLNDKLSTTKLGATRRTNR